MRNDMGCVVMASGLSRRYGKNKLLEPLAGRAVLLRTVDSLRGAGLAPLVVCRSDAVEELARREGVACVRHDGPKKSDTIHAGLEHLRADHLGYLFMPGDQPLTLPDSLRRLAACFFGEPTRAVRLGFDGAAGSPVIFPATCREALLAYSGDRGGVEVLKQSRVPCEIVPAAYAWELWDVDTPESMARAAEVVARDPR